MINRMQFLQAMNNPQQFVENLMQNNQAMQNPLMRNGMDLLKRGDVNGLKSLTENVAKEKGTSIDEVLKRLGL